MELLLAGLGMHNQYSRGSSLIGFVRHDAAFIVDRIKGQRNRPTGPTGAGRS
jgi:hypothetical protein